MSELCSRLCGSFGSEHSVDKMWKVSRTIVFESKIILKRGTLLAILKLQSLLAISIAVETQSLVKGNGGLRGMQWGDQYQDINNQWH